SWGDPWQLVPPGSTVPGALAAKSRMRDIVEVFWIEPGGGVEARTWFGGGPVHGADAVAQVQTLSPDGITLELVRRGPVYAPFTIRKPNGFLLNPQLDQTPTGAFSHDGFVYVFFIVHDKPRRPEWPFPVTYLTRTTDPALGEPYEEVFGLSKLRFWQVAPWVVDNNSIAGLPSQVGKGLVMLGGGPADHGGDAVHLAWMPLIS